MTDCKDLFVCGICKASFRCDSFSRFMEHKMLHTDANKRIYCFLCLKSFPKRNALQVHLEKVHAIPQKNKTSDLDSSNSTPASGSARCKPCVNLNNVSVEHFHIANNEELDSCLSQTNRPSSLDVSLSQQQQQEDCDMNSVILNRHESPENSNLSIDVLTNDDPTIEFPLNTLNYCDNVCCNRLLISDEINGDIEGDFVHSNTLPSSLPEPKDKNGSEFLIVNQHDKNEDTGLPLASNGENVAKLNGCLVENGKPLSPSLEGIEKRNKKKGEGEELKTKLEKDSVDFHFLLGTTSISGNSMTYERVEFKCMHCSFSSAWRPSLVKHMKITHNDILDFHEILDIQSVSSSKTSSSQSELSKKYKIMKLSEHSKMTLKNKSRKAKRMVRSVEYQDIPGKYTCPVCNKVFTRIRYIRRHQMTHKTQRSYLCDHCGKSFKTRSTLVVHSRIHNVKLYHCPQCDFVSNLTGAIHRHRQIHPSGSAVCEICGTVYTDKSTLKKHMRVHDPSRPYPCTESNCTWRFNSENLMKAHVKSHTVEGKFQCTHCGYRFRHKHHLQRHITRIHPQESLIENSPVTVTPSPNNLVFGPSVSNPDIFLQSSSLSDLHHRQELNYTLNSHQNNEVVHKSVLHSDSGISLESGNQTQTSCDLQNHLQVKAQERTECKQSEQQNVIQVLMNNNGQDIVISLPPDINPDLINNGNVNLDFSDVMPQFSPGRVYVIRDDQH